MFNVTCEDCEGKYVGIRAGLQEIGIVAGGKQPEKDEGGNPE
jgi:hypothetical protein